MSTGLGSFAKDMTTKFTLPVLGVVAVAVDGAKKIDDAYRTISRGTGQLGKPLDDLKKAFDDTFKKVPADAQTVAGAIVQIHDKLGLVGTQLSTVTTAMLTFAEATGAALDPAVVAKYFERWKVGAADMGPMLDKLARLSQATGVSGEVIAQQATTMAPALQQGGFTADQGAAMIAYLQQSGAKSQAVLMGFQRVETNAQKFGLDPKQVISDLMQALKDGTGNLASDMARMSKSGSLAAVGGNAPGSAGALAQDKIAGLIAQENALLAKGTATAPLDVARISQEEAIKQKIRDKAASQNRPLTAAETVQINQADTMIGKLDAAATPKGLTSAQQAQLATIKDTIAKDTGGSKATTTNQQAIAALLGPRGSLETQYALGAAGQQKYQNLITTETKGPTIEQMAASTRSFSEQMKILGHNVDEALKPIGMWLITAGTDMVGYLTPIVSTLSGWFSGLPSIIKTGFAGLMIGGAVIGPVLLGIGKVMSMLDKMGQTAGKITGTITKLVPGLGSSGGDALVPATAGIAGEGAAVAGGAVPVAEAAAPAAEAAAVQGSLFGGAGMAGAEKVAAAPVEGSLFGAAGTAGAESAAPAVAALTAEEAALLAEDAALIPETAGLDAALVGEAGAAGAADVASGGFVATLLPIVGTVALVAAALVVAGVGIYEMVTHWKGLQTAAVEAWAWIKQAASDAWGVMEPILVDIGHYVVDVVVGAFHMLVRDVPPILAGIASAAVTVWSVMEPILVNLANMVSATMVAAFNLLKPVIDALWWTVSQTFTSFAAAATTTWGIVGPILGLIGSVIRDIAISAFTEFTHAAEGVWHVLETVAGFVDRNKAAQAVLAGFLVATAVPALTAVATALWGQVTAMGASLVGYAQMGIAAIGFVTTSIASVLGGLASMSVALYDQAAAWLVAQGGIAGLVVEAATFVAESVVAVISGLAGMATHLYETAAATLVLDGGFAGMILSAGTFIVESVVGMVAGLAATATSLYVAATASAAFGAALDFALGPIGWIIAGVSLIVTAFAGVGSAADNASSATTAWLSSFEQGIGSATDKVSAIQAELDKLDALTAAQLKIMQTTKDGSKAQNDAAIAYQDAATKIAVLVPALDKAKASAAAYADGQKALGTELNNQKTLDDAAAQGQKNLATAQDSVKTSARNTSQALSDLTTQTHNAYSAALDADGANIAWTLHLDDLKNSVKNTSNSLDTSTVAGANNKKLVDELVGSTQTLIEKELGSGDTAAAQKDKIKGYIGTLNDGMKQAGFTADQIANMNTQFGLVPGKVEPIIDANISAAEAKMAALDKEMQFLSSASVAGAAIIGGSYSMPAGVPMAVVNGKLVPQGTVPTGPALGHRAAGGPVTAGHPYLVGEKGPELFMPNLGGAIVDSTTLMGAMAGATGVHSVNVALSKIMAATDVATAAATAKLAAIRALVAGGGGGGGPAGTAGPAGSSGGANRALMQKMAAAVGWTGSQWDALYAVEMREAGFNQFAQNPHSSAYGIAQCVGLDTTILTKRGWLRHDEVVIGDETIGYNPATGSSEWTPITAILHLGIAEVWQFGTAKWSARCTPNHRWLMERMVKDKPRGEEMVALQDNKGRSHRVILSRRAQLGRGSLDISVKEAALLGWIAGDGWQEKERIIKRREPSGGHRTYTRSMTYYVSQTKRQNFDHIEWSMGDGKWAVHRTFTTARTGVFRDPIGTQRTVTSKPGHRWWRLSSIYARDLTARAGNPKTDAVEQVLRMSDEQRAAWLDAITRGEGHVALDYSQISQAEGPIADAIKIAVYLSGKFPGIYKDRRRSRTRLTIGPTIPHVGLRLAYCEPAGHEEVWCVTTTLGTWTAEQDDQIFLTGNSLPPTKMPFAGQKAGGSDPATQIAWMLSYIKGRYGTPAGALGQEQRVGWYDKGGVLPPGLTMAMNTTGHNEYVTSGLAAAHELGPAARHFVEAMAAGIAAAQERNAPAASQPNREYHITVHNPVAETAEESIGHQMSRLAYLGVAG